LRIFELRLIMSFWVSLDAHPEFDLSWGRFWLTPQAQFPETLSPQTECSRGETSMKRVTRRQFVRRTTAGLAGIPAYRLPPAFGQDREITMLEWSHFVPESDTKLKQLVGKFARDAKVGARSDHVPNVQIATKQAGQVQTKAGHDIMMFYNEQTWRYRDQLVDL